MAVPCLVCKGVIHASLDGIRGDETTSIMFEGDTDFERGRYNIHERCMKGEFSKQLLTMEQLEGKAPIQPLAVR